MRSGPQLRHNFHMKRFPTFPKHMSGSGVYQDLENSACLHAVCVETNYDGLISHAAVCVEFNTYSD